LTATEFGSEVHSILAGAIVQDPSMEAVELAQRFTVSNLGREALRARRSAREQAFVMAVDDVVLRGQIDLWFEHGRELVLVDYKTDNVKLPIDPGVIRAYEVQLQIYAIALQHLAGRAPDRAYLYFLRPNHATEINVQPLELSAARESVRAFRAAQDIVSYPLQQGDHCFRCEFYKGMCPAGRSRAAAHGETGGE
jgi:CRISPR/Cas system-associated exonuclease Cas4 (RecB family)